MLKRFLLATLVLGFCSTSAFAQDDVFLSFGQGANVTDTATVAPTETSGTVFLFSNGGPDGFSFQSFNVTAISSNPDVAQVSSATIFNPQLPGQFGGPGPNRFTNPGDNAAPGDDIFSTFGPNSETGVEELSLVGVGSFNGDAGVISQAGAVDETFDADANAFLIAEINYDIVGSGTTEFSLGTTDISFLVSTSPAEVFGTPSIGTATLQVAVVPEPTSFGVLALGLVGVVARRRRR